MSAEAPVTAVEKELGRRRQWTWPLGLLAALVLLSGIVAVGGGVAALVRLATNATPTYDDPVEHFKYGSIGAEISSGIPYELWRVLPRLFPEHFDGSDDYSAFGFLYEKDAEGTQRELPMGVARRDYRGVELVWLNCAVCHVGTYRLEPGGPTHVVAGMPSNNLDLGRFTGFILDIADDERLTPDRLIPAMEANGTEFGFVDRLVWRYVVLPQLREGLLAQRGRLLPLQAAQPPWGPGRVDTFNPYKLGQMQIPFASLTEAERVGTADFPSIFLQRPREGMQLHWDGNNNSLRERNLSAALGAGVTPETVDHASLARVVDWLLDLEPPPSPIASDAASVARGKAIYMSACASCHGYQDADRYVFEGAALGKVTPIGAVGTDPGRLDSYTPAFRDRQLSELFAGTPYQFKSFTKTDGYANAPLDGLWLRAPYLHNGSVPTLADLLKAPSERPAAFVRGIDVVDTVNGGMLAPPCDPDEPSPDGFCFDTAQPGNGNGGHAYGTGLAAADKADLLAYLKTF